MLAATGSRYYRFSETNSKESAMNIKNFSNKTGASNPTTGAAHHTNFEEESNMKSNETHQGILENLTGINPARFMSSIII